MVNLDCITLLVMHSVWPKRLTYRKALGKKENVKWSRLCPPRIRPEIPAGQRSLCGYDTWLHTARHSKEGDCRAVFVTCWRLSSWISGTPRLYFAQRAERSCALYSIIPAWSRASRSESTHCSCSLLLIDLFMLSVVRFAVCLVSETYPLFQV